MNKFQRIKDVLFGVLIILYAAAMFIVPAEGYKTAAAIIALLLLIYGFRLLWYYFTMARHMVGGKSSLYQAIIILDLGLFTGSVVSMSSFIILFYLLGIFAFTGLIDVLRAFEAKRVGGAWKAKLISGSVSVIFALAMLIIGVILGNDDILVYGFGVSLIYAGAVRIYTAFRKTAVVYIQ